MNDISGTYRDGHIELDAAVDWPDGSRVRVSAEPPYSNGTSDVGIDPADYQDTPEFRARLIAQMDAFEPLDCTPAEEAEWHAARKAIKDRWSQP